jgi:glycosyltransferase A (GT-A) superfamily protein (DUF2064 family)
MTGSDGSDGSDGLTVLVLAKSPRAGRSKTRLAPVFGFDGAAALAAAALADTLDAVAAADVDRRVLVLDGDGIPALPAGFDVVPQRSGSHAERIEAALAAASGPALLIGMDTPQVTPELLSLDITDRTADAWFGLAADGGWWTLGLRNPARDAGRVLAGVPMSTPETGALQRIRLTDLGLRVVTLPTLRDVDEPADAFAVADLVPGSRFGRLVRALAPSGAVGAGVEAAFGAAAGVGVR